jgi:dipeptidyl aminopeptidase/acylaminoacyl peptidase
MTTATAQLIPRELLFGNPVKAAPKVSPNGQRLSYLAPDEGVLNLWIADSLEPGAATQVLTKDRGRGIRAYFWAEDNVSLIYLQDKDGDENWRLYQVNIETREVRDLTPFEGVQAQALATDPKFPDFFYAGLNVRDKRLHDVYKIHLKTGKAELVIENPGDILGWSPDQNFAIRLAKAQLPDGSTELRILEEGKWRTLLTWSPDEQGGAHGFTPDNRRIYLETSLGTDTTRLVEFDPQDGAETELFRHPKVDVGPIAFHPTSYKAQAVGYDVDRLKWEILDDTIASDFKKLGEVYDGDFHIVSRDDADRVWIVQYTVDDGAPRYYLYDRKTGDAQFLFTTRPDLEERTLGRMTPISFAARDGLEIHGYLTLPPEHDCKKDGALPMILNVHGGPWARDHWGFHPEVAWLADRGYAVLQVNFRASTGYGKKFLHAGDKEWGAKMQDDLTDAVRWAVEQGYADAKRVAIYGGSYGGYAALAGAAFTPDVYACAVDIVGPSNLETLIRSIPPYWEIMRRIFDLRVGDIDKEQEFLKKCSPLYSADKITIPMLIAQGANDPRVKQAESEMIVDALKKNGKDVEYLLFPDEGHGFAKPENRLKYYAVAERFLAKHLGGRTQG